MSERRKNPRARQPSNNPRFYATGFLAESAPERPFFTRTQCDAGYDNWGHPRGREHQRNAGLDTRVRLSLLVTSVACGQIDMGRLSGVSDGVLPVSVSLSQGRLVDYTRRNGSLFRGAQIVDPEFWPTVQEGLPVLLEGEISRKNGTGLFQAHVESWGLADPAKHVGPRPFRGLILPQAVAA